MAGAVGIEPTQAVLETAVLPLYDAPRNRPEAIWLFGFFMQRHLFAEFAKLFELQAFLGVLFVLVGLVIQIMADRAFQIDEVVLGHSLDLRFRI